MGRPQSGVTEGATHFLRLELSSYFLLRNTRTAGKPWSFPLNYTGLGFFLTFQNSPKLLKVKEKEKRKGPWNLSLLHRKEAWWIPNLLWQPNGLL